MTTIDFIRVEIVIPANKVKSLAENIAEQIYDDYDLSVLKTAGYKSSNELTEIIFTDPSFQKSIEKTVKSLADDQEDYLYDGVTYDHPPKIVSNIYDKLSKIQTEKDKAAESKQKKRQLKEAMELVKSAGFKITADKV